MSALPKWKPREEETYEVSDFARKLIDDAMTDVTRLPALLNHVGMLEFRAYSFPLLRQSAIVEKARAIGFDGGYVAGYEARAWKAVCAEYPDLSLAEQAVLVEAEGAEARVKAESARARRP